MSERDLSLPGHFPPTQVLPQQADDLPQPVGSLSRHAPEGTKPLNVPQTRGRTPEGIPQQTKGWAGSPAGRQRARSPLPLARLELLRSAPARRLHRRSASPGFSRLPRVSRLDVHHLHHNRRTQRSRVCCHRSLIPPSLARFRSLASFAGSTWPRIHTIPLYF